MSNSISYFINLENMFFIKHGIFKFSHGNYNFVNVKELLGFQLQHLICSSISSINVKAERRKTPTIMETLYPSEATYHPT